MTDSSRYEYDWLAAAAAERRLGDGGSEDYSTPDTGKAVLEVEPGEDPSTVARNGHPADLFFTPRAHVNRVYVRT